MGAPNPPHGPGDCADPFCVPGLGGVGDSATVVTIVVSLALAAVVGFALYTNRKVIAGEDAACAQVDHALSSTPTVHIGGVAW